MVILFPENGVSAIQKAQMTSVTSPRTCVIGSFVDFISYCCTYQCILSLCFTLNVGVKGDFDFCQTAIKDTFTDEAYNDWLSKKFGYVLRSAIHYSITASPASCRSPRLMLISMFQRCQFYKHCTLATTSGVPRLVVYTHGKEWPRWPRR